MDFKVGDKVTIKDSMEVHTITEITNYSSIPDLYRLSNSLWIEGQHLRLSSMVPRLTPTKYDEDKPRLDLIRPEFLIEIGKALEFGQKKYNEQVGETPNYLKGRGFYYTRLIASTLRHFTSWCSGVQIDNESGINHLILAAVNIMFLFTYDISNNGIDDRVILDKK